MAGPAIKEAERAFDGSLMPTVDLPKIPLTNLEATLANAMKPLKSLHPSCMGVIYGDAGTKKTTTAFEMMQEIVPDDKIILYVDSAAGWTVLMNYPHLMRRTMRLVFENIEQLMGLAAAIKSGKAPFDRIGGIVFDEYTMMHDHDLNWIVETRAAQAKKDGGFKDSFTPALPDYNAARIRSNKLIGQLLTIANCHVIFIGHDKQTKKLETVPDMPEKAGKALYSKTDFCYYLYHDAKDGNKWKMLTTGANRIMAKNRINGIGSFTTSEEFVKCYTKWGIAKPDEVVLKPVDVEDPADLAKLLE